jgi:TBC1 domain family member 2
MMLMHTLTDRTQYGETLPAFYSRKDAETGSSTSPFWKHRSGDKSGAPADKPQKLDPNIVVGASYSHADILKIESLYAGVPRKTIAELKPSRSLGSGSSRPKTPPTLTTTKSRESTSSNSRKESALTSPPRRTYTDFLSHTNNDWAANDDADDDDIYGYGDNDGDDFGLPSVSSIRRKAKKTPTSTDIGNNYPSLSPWGNGLASPGILGSRRLSNSADIAVERPAPSYPQPRKTEGKILRPQYKEILRGELDG